MLRGTWSRGWHEMPVFCRVALGRDPPCSVEHSLLNIKLRISTAITVRKVTLPGRIEREMFVYGPQAWKHGECQARVYDMQEGKRSCLLTYA